MAGWFRTETIVRKRRKLNKKRVKEDVTKLSLSAVIVGAVAFVALIVAGGSNQ